MRKPVITSVVRSFAPTSCPRQHHHVVARQRRRRDACAALRPIRHHAVVRRRRPAAAAIAASENWLTLRTWPAAAFLRRNDLVAGGDQPTGARYGDA
jgi:hypothetical protein